MNSPCTRAVAHVRQSLILSLAMLACAVGSATAQQTWHVAPGGSGTGASSAPFGRIQQALQAAQPGDTVLVAPGTYAEALSTVRPGLPDLPITVRAAGARGSVLVTRPGQVLLVGHADIVIQGLVLDAQYAAADAVRVSSAGHRLWLRDVEVRRSARDCIDMAAPQGVRIEDSLVHRCLWWNGARQDAHGIVAGSVRGLLIRNVQIHSFSGDAIQLDPGRSLPGWDDVTIENSTMSLAPLTVAEAGFSAGMVPGENAVDTKTHASAPRATLTIRNSVASGFRNGLISNMAAFNLKENVEATVDGVTVHASSIGFRLRGPGPNGGAWVTLKNIVVHDVATAIRYEDGIERVAVAHATFGSGIGRVFQAANSGWAGVDVRNSVVLGSALPVEAPAAGSNLTAPASAFVDAAAHDYRPQAGAPLLDLAPVLPDVPVDRSGAPRVQGPAPDVGAYERPVALTAPTLTGVPLASDPTNTARLVWTNVAGESGYEVERSSDGRAFTRITTRKADATSYDNSKLPSGRTYWFRVRAVIGTQPQAYSNVVAVRMLPEGGVPAAPRNLVASPSPTAPSTTVLLTWEDTTTNEDGFTVERSTDGVTFVRIATRGIDVRTYTSANLSPGTTYVYRVRAYNGLGTGDASATASIRTR